MQCFFFQTVAVGVIKSTTPKDAAGVTTKAAQKVGLRCSVRVHERRRWVFVVQLGFTSSEGGSCCSVRVHERRSVALMLVLFNRIYKILVIFLGFFKVEESRSVDLTGNLFNQICFKCFGSSTIIMRIRILLVFLWIRGLRGGWDPKNLN